MLRRFAVAAAVAVLATACHHGQPAAHRLQHSVDPASVHGATESSGQARPDFALVDTGGRPYDFAAQTRGRVTLLYFGYTHCPDECPTSMADVATALRKLPPAVSARVTVVFATTDPWRDTATVLRHWLNRFAPPEPFIGLTGTATQIAGAEVRMGMPISTREPAPKSYGAGKYAVSHFAGVWVYGRDDRLVTVYPSGTAPADIATDLQVLVKG